MHVNVAVDVLHVVAHPPRPGDSPPDAPVRPAGSQPPALGAIQR